MFSDRADAGRLLAERLRHLSTEDVLVLGLPRGGVPVAVEVARALKAPLDVVVVRKLGMPGRPEVAMGAVGEGGVVVVDDEVMTYGRVGPRELAAAREREEREVERRVVRFRGGRPPQQVHGRKVVLVDDGIATGSTARAACRVVRAQGAARVVLAAPVAPEGAVRRVRGEADEVVCLETPRDFYAVGQWYRDFTQTSDDEVVRLLQTADAAGDRDASGEERVDEDVLVPAGTLLLPGRLTVPPRARCVVVFAHGRGSSRHSPRNDAVAAALQQRGLATLLLDLLTADEEGERELVLDVELLAGRLAGAVRWVRQWAGLASLPVGLFGASTGAAAALWVAADPASRVSAVVCRGGRPDLAASRLPQVHAPTLLVVGGRDDVVLELNRRAQALLRCESRLVVVPEATHLFEEPGALQAVAALAAEWFVAHRLQVSTAPSR